MLLLRANRKTKIFHQNICILIRVVDKMCNTCESFYTNTVTAVNSEISGLMRAACHDVSVTWQSRKHATLHSHACAGDTDGRPHPRYVVSRID